MPNKWVYGTKRPGAGSMTGKSKVGASGRTPSSLPRGKRSQRQHHRSAWRSTRVSSAENKSNLDRQTERLAAYCTARGYQVAKVVKEVGSGVNDARPKLLALLTDQSIGLIVVEHKDRLTRFGFRYLDTLLTAQGRAIEVVNPAENGTEDLLADLTAIVYSFCARLYGQRRAQRKTAVIVRELAAREVQEHEEGDGDATG